MISPILHPVLWSILMEKDDMSLLRLECGKSSLDCGDHRLMLFRAVLTYNEFEHETPWAVSGFEKALTLLENTMMEFVQGDRQ